MLSRLGSVCQAIQVSLALPPSSHFLLPTAEFAESRLVQSEGVIDRLKNRVRQLEDALSEAKENRSPVAKQVDKLEEKLGDISQRQRQR